MPRHEFGKPVKRQALARSGGLCECIGCDKAAFRRGYCSIHYGRLIRNGSTDAASLRKAPNGLPMKWVLDHVGHKGEACLTYPFAKGRAGKVTHNGERRSAFETMCELAHGQRPTDAHEVAHNCGKGHEGCINPEHIRWATHIDNLADRIPHGTSNRGERHGLSKFTREDVLNIRQAVEAGERQASIAARLGTGRGTIGKIARGERWGWLNVSA